MDTIFKLVSPGRATRMREDSTHLTSGDVTACGAKWRERGWLIVSQNVEPEVAAESAYFCARCRKALMGAISTHV